MKKDKLPSSSEWYNPSPVTIGQIIEEHFTENKRHKSLIIKRQDGNFTVYLYDLDDSDLTKGYDNAVGWVARGGPSITDNLETARELAKKYLPS